MRFLSGCLLAAFLLPAAAGAQVCSAPIEPWCVGQSTTYESRQSVTGCYEEIEIYMRQVDNYAQCLRDKAATASERAEEVRKQFCSRPSVDRCS